MSEELRISKHLETFMNCIAECRELYPIATENYEIENSRQQDLLHAIEFEPQAEKLNGWAAKLHKNRLDRRHWKDVMEETETIVKFFEDPQNKKTYEKMKQLLGAVRKVEEYHEKRSYKQRVKEG